MRKKKILFVMESLRIGGAEKSLLTLLSLLDYEKYDVELFLFSFEGELMDLLPKQVKLLSEDKKYKIFRSNRKLAPLQYLKERDIKRAWYSTKYLVGCIRQRVLSQPLYIGWNQVTHLFDDRRFEADISIAYLERKCIYFNVDHVKASKKIGFIHNDYSTYDFDDYLDRTYFKYYNSIATVSSHCQDVLRKIFPEYQDKFTVMTNMVSAELVQALATESLPESTKNNKCSVLVTVGRLVKQKGYDNAIKVCKKLVEDRQNIIWYAVGDGPDRIKLQEQIESLGLEKNFILVGAQKNPYKWMNLADVYVQPSRFEGFGITVAEAKVLNKPIVCSDIPEFREQLGNREYCYAKDNNQLVKNIEQQLKSPVCVRQRKDENSKIMNHFYSMLG